MERVPFGILIAGTIVGTALGLLSGPCCGAWREIARAECVIVFAAIGFSVAAATRFVISMSIPASQSRFSLKTLLEIIVVGAIFSGLFRTYVQRIQVARQHPVMDYDGGPVSRWFEECARKFIAHPAASSLDP